MNIIRRKNGSKLNMAMRKIFFSKIPFLKKIIGFLGFSIIIFFASNVSSETAGALEKQKELKELQVKIKKLLSSIEDKKKEKSEVVENLKGIERKIGRVVVKIDSLNKKIKSKTSTVKKLRRDKELEYKKLKSHKGALTDQVVAAYAVGRQGYFKMMLNQKDPSKVARTFVYYDYLNKARARKIDEVIRILDDIESIESNINRQIDLLEKDKRERETEITLLERTKGSRQKLLSEIQSRIESGTGSLSSLRLNEKKLQGLIKNLQDVLSDIPAAYDKIKKFSELKGRLMFPVAGKITGKFGRKGNPNGGVWRGVFIEASEGKAVKAVSNGRVVFSDWFRGLGLLTIIDHGDGYMSLYGHNQSLYKSAGEWVEAGETVSTVGLSGGNTKSGLYFEIRKKGKTQNPMKWCKR